MQTTFGVRGVKIRTMKKRVQADFSSRFEIKINKKATIFNGF